MTVLADAVEVGFHVPVSSPYADEGGVKIQRATRPPNDNVEAISPSL